MTSKERVLCAFRREKSDRVPMNTCLTHSTEQKLLKHFNTNDIENVYEALDIDFRKLLPDYIGKPLFKQVDGLKVDPIYGFYMRWTRHETGGYWSYCNFPLENANDDFIANYPLPSPDEFDYESAKEKIKRWKGKAIHIGDPGYGDIINATGRVMGMENTLINLMTEDEATLHYINRRLNMELGILERFLDMAGDEISFVWMGEDLGTQIAPMISLDLFRRVIRPLHQKIINLAKSYKKPVMMHSCGSASWAFEDFIEMGVDAVDAVQPEAKNMSPDYLALKFGERLSFHGCISTGGALAYKTASDVERTVRETLEIMMPYKGYMLAPANTIQDNTPVENIIAMYQAGKLFGKY